MIAGFDLMFARFLQKFKCLIPNLAKTCTDTKGGKL